MDVSCVENNKDYMPLTVNKVKIYKLHKKKHKYLKEHALLKFVCKDSKAYYDVHGFPNNYTKHYMLNNNIEYLIKKGVLQTI